MKRLLALSLILLSPSVVLAQPAGETAKKPTTKTAAKAPAKKTETSSRTQLNSAANQAAAGIRAADVALTPAELAIADRVFTGTMPCELGASVMVEADAKSPGYFNVRGKASPTACIRWSPARAPSAWRTTMTAGLSGCNCRTSRC
jgi:hypothetical protein